VLLRQQLEAHAAAECGALAVGSMELANGKRQDCLPSAVLACPLLPDEWSGAVADTDRDWSHDTYDRTNTTESTSAHFSASNSPTNQWGPLTEDSDMVIQGLGGHTYQHDADAETASELSLSPCPVSLKTETCFEAVAQAASSLSLQSRDVRWSAPRTLRTTPDAHASASIQKQWLQEGEEECLTTPLSPRAHVLHTSVLSKLFLFQQSKALIGGGEALALKLVSGEALGLKAGEEAEEVLGLTADEEALGLKVSSRVPVRPTPAQPLTQTHCVAASAHVKDGVAASAHGGIAKSEMCESWCYAVAHKSARAELARHSGARVLTPKTLLQTPVQASAASKRRQIAQLHAHAFALAHAQNRVRRDSARQRSEEVMACNSDFEMRHDTCSALACLNRQSPCPVNIRTHVCDHFESAWDGAAGSVAVVALKMDFEPRRLLDSPTPTDTLAFPSRGSGASSALDAVNLESLETSNNPHLLGGGVWAQHLD
jgi:hypothetical protein